MLESTAGGRRSSELWFNPHSPSVGPRDPSVGPRPLCRAQTPPPTGLGAAPEDGQPGCLEAGSKAVKAKGSHRSEPSSQPFRGTCSLASCSCSAESPERSTGRAGWKKSLTLLKACRNPDGVHTRSASIPFRTCSHSLSPSLPLSLSVGHGF